MTGIITHFHRQAGTGCIRQEDDAGLVFRQFSIGSFRDPSSCIVGAHVSFRLQQTDSGPVAIGIEPI